MNSLRQKFYDIFLPTLVRKIPQIQVIDINDKTNSIIVRFNNGEDPYLVVLGMEEGDLKCSEWDGNRFATDKVVPIHDIYNSPITITHFYGQSRIAYDSLYSYIISRYLTFFPYIKIHLYRMADNVGQFLFNRRSLESKERITFLRSLLHMYAGNEPFGAIQVAQDQYGIRFFGHPDMDFQLNKISFFLDSLVNTGELMAIQHRYQLTGLAYKAVAQFEEEDRRHSAINRTQWIAIFITIILALLAMVQAGLIYVPVLVDFTN